MASIDVLVPVHSPTRPIARLAASVLTGNGAAIRLIVVAHNTPPEGIRAALGEFDADPRVELLAVNDGIPSPAGPLRRALEAVSAPYFAKIDSDDWLAPGALDSWLLTASRHDASIVLPRMQPEGARGSFPTPPRRRMRRILDPVRDRLAYRTSTMGLISSRLIPLASPTPGLIVGEDIVPSIRLWFRGGRIVRAPHRATYSVGSTAGDRTTASVKPLAEELGFARALVDDEVFMSLPPSDRAAVVAKMIRVHISSSAWRSASLGLPGDDGAALTEATRVLVDAAPEVKGFLSRADLDLVQAITAGGADAARLATLAASRGRYLRPRSLQTSRMRNYLARDAPLRFLTASTLTRWMG